MACILLTAGMFYQQRNKAFVIHQLFPIPRNVGLVLGLAYVAFWGFLVVAPTQTLTLPP